MVVVCPNVWVSTQPQINCMVQRVVFEIFAVNYDILWLDKRVKYFCCVLPRRNFFVHHCMRVIKVLFIQL